MSLEVEIFGKGIQPLTLPPNWCRLRMSFSRSFGSVVRGPDRVYSVKKIVPGILVEAAVERAAAGLGLDGDDHAGIAAIFRVERRHLHLELGNRIDGGLGVLRLIVADIQVGAAVQVEVILRAPAAANVHHADVVEGQVKVGTPAGRDTGNRPHQRGPVAAVHRQFRDLLLLDQEGLLHAIGLNDRGFTRDLDHRADLTDLHGQLADVEFRVYVELDIPNAESLKACELYFQRIDTRLNAQRLESARVVRNRFTNYASLRLVNQLDRGSGQHAARLVHDRTADQLRLPVHERRHQRERQQDGHKNNVRSLHLSSPPFVESQRSVLEMRKTYQTTSASLGSSRPVCASAS